MSVTNGFVSDSDEALGRRWLIQVFAAIYIQVSAIGVIILVHFDPGLQCTLLIRGVVAVQVCVCARLKYGPITSSTESCFRPAICVVFLTSRPTTSSVVRPPTPRASAFAAMTDYVYLVNYC